MSTEINRQKIITERTKTSHKQGQVSVNAETTLDDDDGGGGGGGGEMMMMMLIMMMTTTMVMMINKLFYRKTA